MIITGLRIAGFRGIRGSLELRFANGFTVLTGRNGSGKSTVCDAIEYALLGSIRASSLHKEKGESIADYLWWKGQSRSVEQSVTLTLRQSSSSQVVTLKRTPTSFEMTGGPQTVHEAVCAIGDSGGDPVGRLCRTSIIRDEEITQLSVDLPEADRFEFVRLALGTHDFSPVEVKLKATQKLLDDQLLSQQRQYDASRQKVADITTRLSIARSEAARASDVREAEASLRAILLSGSDTNLDLLDKAQRQAATNRNRLDSIMRAARRLADAEARNLAISTAEYLSQLEDKRKTAEMLSDAIESARAMLTEAEANLNVQRRDLPRLTSLSELFEIGQRLGLQDGRCPLCGSTVEDFAEHISDALNALRQTSSSLTEATEQVSAKKREVVRLTAELEAARSMYSELEGRSAEVERSIQRERDELATHGMPQTASASAAAVAEFVEGLRMQTTALDNAISTLESSHAQGRVVSLEQELVEAKTEAQETERALEAVREAAQRSKDAASTVKRIQGEFIEERLAQLSPLISELYLRLRPHVDWRKIHYKLRGDVRRMLSFQVGEGLNPSFVFSSGQRRAAGLAFLLAVHLSRRWCRLDTLIMDDPVQHIDDFRALNLAEVMGAIRQGGRQIICAVEDESLGDLLCRRLRSGADSEGMLVTMAYDSDRGVHVQSERQIRATGAQIVARA